jgi:hypothetical protein
MNKFIKRIILLSVLTALSSLQAGTWKETKDIRKQPASVFHLNENILALEIRAYTNNKQSERVVLKIYTKPLKSINKKMMKQFRAVKLNKGRKSDILKESYILNDTSRGFVLYKDGKISRVNEISDVVALLGTIDTPAEAQLVWWLHGKYSGKKLTKKWTFSAPVDKSTLYQKSKNGYKLLHKYTIRGFREKERASREYLEITFKDMMTVTSKGKLVNFKQVSRTKATEPTGGEIL